MACGVDTMKLGGSSMPAARNQMRLIVFAAMVLLGLVGSARAIYAQPASGQIDVITARGVVNPTMAGYIARAIDNAERDGAAALVVELDTPGGLDSSMRQINQRILASRVPVIVYVSPPGGRAGSAGAYIAYAAHLAAMAPNTNIGSATPVAMGEGGEVKLSEEMRNKVTNDAAAYIRSLAERRGRNPDWAERAVREGVNVTEQEALRLGVVNYVAANLRDLLRQADGATVQTAAGEARLETAEATVRGVEMSWIEQLLHVISDPTIAYILLSLGTMGIFLELSNPGSILPGVVGGICLLLGFYALGTLPVNYAGLLLMGFALLLFVAELFAPSHGILTVGGIIAFVLGSLLLFDRPDAGPWLGISLWAIAGVTLVFVLFFGVVVGAVARSQRRKVVSGREGLVGQVGRARTPLDPDGMIHVDGALWEATAEDGAVAKGDSVEVVAMDGLTLKVRAIGRTPDVGREEGVLSSNRAPARSEEPTT
jgi:membrane-bound serine protease (ClpP class)